MEKIGLASDHAGYPLKEQVKEWLTAKGFECVDFGTHSTESCNYPDFAHALATAIENGELSRGIAICGTGNGINMTVVTDANGEALIENLRVDSDYKIEEIEDEVSAKYIRPEAVTVTLLDGMTLVVSLYNQIAPIPEIPPTDVEEDAKDNKTADTICLIITLAGIPFMLVLAYFFVLQPKLKAKKNGKGKYSKKNKQ